MKNIISLSTAGGGKTTRLIKHVEELIKNGAKKYKILIISFTNATCDDILQRCGVQANTFHSFCNSYIKSSEVSEDAGEIIKIHLGKFENLKKLGLSKVTNLVMSYLLYRNLKENEEFLSITNELMDLVRIIDFEKQIRNIIFFPDIINEFAKNIPLEEIYKTYDHIIVDEAQDLSSKQLEILFKLIENIFIDEHKSFFIVGDVKQSIYDFQGASAEFYISFIKNLIKISEHKEVIVENNNETYRFGGEILKHINENFEEHTSKKEFGTFYSLEIENKEATDYMEILVNHLLEKYKPEEIMIVYRQNSSTINKIQNRLANFGFDCKIFTSNNPIVEGLMDICRYIEVSHNPESSMWYKAKILQGPFFHLSEPHFFLLNKMNFLEDYAKEFFESFLNSNNISQAEQIMKVISKNVFANSLDFALFNELYLLSRNFDSFYSFVHNIPETINVKSFGIKFSTIHKSKGLESPVVVYIDLPNFQKGLKFGVNPFFIEKKSNLLDSFEEKTVIKNLDYVASSRGKEALIKVKII